MSQNL